MIDSVAGGKKSTDLEKKEKPQILQRNPFHGHVHTTSNISRVRRDSPLRSSCAARRSRFVCVDIFDAGRKLGASWRVQVSRA